MRKIIRVFIICVVFGIFMVNTAYASDVIPSLDEVVDGTETNDTSPNTTDVQENKKSVITALENAPDVSELDEQAEKVGSVMEVGASFIIQILCYVITIGSTLRVVLDLIYIGLPFLRSVLANGYVGNPNAAGNPQQQQGMGGYGGGMGGMGGYGGGMGGYGSGRYGGGYGGGMGMGGMGGMGMQNQMGMQTAMNNQPKQGRIQFISNAALNAVATENMVGPDGEAHSAFKTYVKDMVVVLIITPILITLAITGVLNQVGFMVGGLIVKAIDGIRGGL